MREHSYKEIRIQVQQGDLYSSHSGQQQQHSYTEFIMAEMMQAMIRREHNYNYHGLRRARIAKSEHHAVGAL